MMKMKQSSLLAIINILNILKPSSLLGNININYFLEWDHKENTIELGQFSKKLKKVYTNNKIAADSLTEEIIQRWLGFDRNKVLLVFHCWLGEYNFVQKTYLTSFKHVFSINTSPVSIISVIWKSGCLKYTRNWKMLFKKQLDWKKPFNLYCIAVQNAMYFVIPWVINFSLD